MVFKVSRLLVVAAIIVNDNFQGNCSCERPQDWLWTVLYYKKECLLSIQKKIYSFLQSVLYYKNGLIL